MLNDKVEVLTSSKLLNKDNVLLFLPRLEYDAETAFDNGTNFQFDVWLTKEYVRQIRSIWIHAQECYFKVVKKIEWYDGPGPEGYRWVYFTKNFLDLLAWQKWINEEAQRLADLEE